MDMQTCAICNEQFNFDKGGLGSSMTGQLVCGNECAKKMAVSHGTHYAIHDNSDAITETNKEEGDIDHG